MSDFVAAIKAGRHYIGYDTEAEYVRLAERRIREYKQQLTIPLVYKQKGDYAIVKNNQEAYTPENISDD